MLSTSTTTQLGLIARDGGNDDNDDDDKEDDDGGGTGTAPIAATAMTTPSSIGGSDDEVRTRSSRRTVEEREERDGSGFGSGDRLRASIRSSAPHLGVAVVSDDSGETAATTDTTILTIPIKMTFFDVVDCYYQGEEVDVEEGDDGEENYGKWEEEEEEEEEENDGSQTSSSSLLLGLSRILIARSRSWDGDNDNAKRDDCDGPADGRWNISFDHDDDNDDEDEDWRRSESTSSPGLDNGRRVDALKWDDIGFVPIGGGGGAFDGRSGRRRSPMSRTTTTTTIGSPSSSHRARTKNFATVSVEAARDQGGRSKGGRWLGIGMRFFPPPYLSRTRIAVHRGESEGITLAPSFEGGSDDDDIEDDDEDDQYDDYDNEYEEDVPLS